MKRSSDQGRLKYYAVRKGRVPGIYLDWDKCRAQVDGFKGAEFKSFSTEVDAKNYLGLKSSKISQSKDTKCDIIAYVDGSCSVDGKRYSSGVVILNSDGRILDITSFADNNPDYIQMRNVAGEILAASYAINYALDNHFTRMEMCYDYEGIEKWCSGEWTARKLATQDYRDLYVSATMSSLWINFTKIKSHSNNFWNDVADKSAKLALGMIDKEELMYALVDGLYNIYHPSDYQQLSDILLTKAAGFILNTSMADNYLNIEDDLGRTITYSIKEG